jgi:hypothetical protein
MRVAISRSILGVQILGLGQESVVDVARRRARRRTTGSWRTGRRHRAARSARHVVWRRRASPTLRRSRRTTSSSRSVVHHGTAIAAATRHARHTLARREHQSRGWSPIQEWEECASSAARIPIRALAVAAADSELAPERAAGVRMREAPPMLLGRPSPLRLPILRFFVPSSPTDRQTTILVAPTSTVQRNLG